MPARYWGVHAYSSDSKATGTEITPTSGISHLLELSRDLKLNEANEYTLQLGLTDKDCRNIGKGHYMEAWYGYVTKRMAFNGYVEDMQKIGGDNTWQFTLSASMSHLAGFSLLGSHDFLYANGFTDILKVCNGTNQPGKYAVPGQYGLLTGTGWRAVWVGPGKPPGKFKQWRADWANALESIVVLCTQFHLFFRERPGSTRYNGVIEIGPLGDSSGLQIWGGQPLLDLQNVKLPFPFSGQVFNFDHPNAEMARKQNLSVINTATYEEQMTNIFNLVWPTGHGEGKDLVTIRSEAGTVPPADQYGNAINGWVKVDPNPYGPQGRVLYSKPASTVTWQGHQFSDVAAQEQDGLWAYGVADFASIRKYGFVFEHPYHDHQAKDAVHLKASALGQLDNSSDPVASWTFDVEHPMNTPDARPPLVLPGQTIDVRFAGYVHAVNPSADNPGFFNSPSTSPLIGLEAPQFVETDSNFKYMDYPGTTDAEQIAKLKRITEVSDTWDASGFKATYTLGKGKKKRRTKEQLLDLAKRMHPHPHPRRKAKFVKQNFENAPWLLSIDPNATEARVDGEEGLLMQPGAIAVADVPAADWFNDHHQVSFTVDLKDDQWVQFWFAKAIDGTVSHVDSSADYAFFRVAGKKSGVKSGLFTRKWGTGATVSHGKTPGRQFRKEGKVVPGGKWNVVVHWSAQTIEAHMDSVDGNHHRHIAAAVWHDHEKAITQWGSIGFYAGGGSQTIEISHVHARPKKRKTSTVTGGTGAGTQTSTVRERQGPGGNTTYSYDPDNDSLNPSHREYPSGGLQARSGMATGPGHATNGIIDLIGP